MELCFLYSHSYRVAGIAVHFLLDILTHTDDIADGTVRIFDAHIYNASAIWDAIEGGRYFYQSFSKHTSDVKWNPDIFAALIRNRFNDSIKFVNFFIHVFPHFCAAFCASWSLWMQRRHKLFGVKDLSFTLSIPNPFYCMIFHLPGI